MPTPCTTWESRWRAQRLTGRIDGVNIATPRSERHRRVRLIFIIFFFSHVRRIQMKIAKFQLQYLQQKLPFQSIWALEFVKKFFKKKSYDNSFETILDYISEIGLIYLFYISIAMFFKSWFSRRNGKRVLFYLRRFIARTVNQRFHLDQCAIKKYTSKTISYKEKRAQTDLIGFSSRLLLFL